LAAPAALACLSPDGKTLAVIQPEAIGFIGTDGQTATYRRWKKKTSPAGVVWKDNRTLVALSAEKGKPIELNYLKTDGTLAAVKSLKIPPVAADDVFAALALSPDGRRMVITALSDAQVLRADGTVLGTWDDGENKLLLFSPTFTPDSKRVAFKLLVKDDGEEAHCTLILFFTPDGKELTRVQIPPVRPRTTQPASEPSD
jgi:WD40 repeat protein